MAAGLAQAMAAGRDTVIECDAFVEDETVALPQAPLFRHGFEIFEDATFEVVDL
jgi:hypothetical protein